MQLIQQTMGDFDLNSLSVVLVLQVLSKEWHQCTWVIFLKSYWSNKCVVPLTVTVFEASFLIICLLTEKMGSPWRSLCFRNLLYWWCGHDHLNCRFLYGIWYIYSCLHPFLLFLAMCSFCIHFDSYTIRVWYSSRFFPPWGQECFWMAFFSRSDVSFSAYFNCLRLV